MPDSDSSDTDSDHGERRQDRREYESRVKEFNALSKRIKKMEKESSQQHKNVHKSAKHAGNPPKGYKNEGVNSDAYLAAKANYKILYDKLMLEHAALKAELKAMAKELSLANKEILALARANARLEIQAEYAGGARQPVASRLGVDRPAAASVRLGPPASLMTPVPADLTLDGASITDSVYTVDTPPAAKKKRTSPGKRQRNKRKGKEPIEVDDEAATDLVRSSIAKLHAEFGNDRDALRKHAVSRRAPQCDDNGKLLDLFGLRHACTAVALGMSLEAVVAATQDKRPASFGMGVAAKPAGGPSSSKPDSDPESGEGSD